MFPAMDTLQANLEYLPEFRKSFARDLIAQAKRGKPLSAKQGEWVVKLAQMAEEGALAASLSLMSADVRTFDCSADDPEVSNPNHFPGLRAMFDRNIANGTKRLGIRMLTDDGVTLRVSLASDGKRLHFAEVSNDEEVEGRYFGYIDAKGEFHESKRTPRDEAVMKALRELDEDPMEFAIAYGKKTGSCCVCGKLLTNKTSVLEGIGPVCSGRLA